MRATENATAERRQLAARMAAMLATSVLLGIAYNTASPLGVRNVASAPPQSSPKTSTNVGNPLSIYQNQTVSLSLETETAKLAAPANPGPNVPHLTWLDTKRLLAAGQIVLVDARAAVYYQTEHIPGAVSLPAGSPLAEVAAFAAKYPIKDTALVIYCGSLSCPLSHQLVTALATQWGYTNVREMPGGFAEYRQVEAQAASGGAK